MILNTGWAMKLQPRHLALARVVWANRRATGAMIAAGRLPARNGGSVFHPEITNGYTHCYVSPPGSLQQ